MPARLLRLLLTIGLLGVVASTTIGLGAFGYACFNGTPLQSTWQVVTDQPSSEPVVRHDNSEAGVIRYEHGRIDIAAGGVVYRLLQGIDLLVVGGLWITILWLARRLVREVTGGKPFQHRIITRLRHIGAMLVGLQIWTVLEALIFQPLLLADIHLADPGAHLLPSISRGVDGARNVRIDFELDQGLLMIGLLLIVIATAFDVGRRLAEDNEAIV
ncbi:MAG: hypothetical protein ABI471_07905 [Sphingomonas bacterium]